MVRPPFPPLKEARPLANVTADTARGLAFYNSDTITTMTMATAPHKTPNVATVPKQDTPDGTLATHYIDVHCLRFCLGCQLRCHGVDWARQCGVNFCSSCGLGLRRLQHFGWCVRGVLSWGACGACFWMRTLSYYVVSSAENSYIITTMPGCDGQPWPGRQQWDQLRKRFNYFGYGHEHYRPGLPILITWGRGKEL